MSLPADISLAQKYPAKEHARKVISCLEDEIAAAAAAAAAAAPATGNDAGSKADAVTGILYVEGQKSRLLEVWLRGF